MDPKALLQESADWMFSDDYKQRFVAEYVQVAARLALLKRVLDNRDDREVEFETTCSRSALEDQASVMEDYAIVLQERADREGIELPNIAA